MENKKMTPQEWEISVKEKLAETDELQLLDLTQDIAIRLASELACFKADIRGGMGIYNQEKEMLGLRIGRLAVMLDVLQLRYGDCAEEELMFLKSIEQCLEET